MQRRRPEFAPIRDDLDDGVSGLQEKVSLIEHGAERAAGAFMMSAPARKRETMPRKTSVLLCLYLLSTFSVAAATKSWTGAVNNLWSAGANWNDGLPPADGDSLVFPNGGANRNTVNDLTGLDLVSISIALP